MEKRKKPERWERRKPLEKSAEIPLPGESERPETGAQENPVGSRKDRAGTIKSADPPPSCTSAQGEDRRTLLVAVMNGLVPSPLSSYAGVPLDSFNGHPVEAGPIHPQMSPNNALQTDMVAEFGQYWGHPMLQRLEAQHLATGTENPYRGSESRAPGRGPRQTQAPPQNWHHSRPQAENTMPSQKGREDWQRPSRGPYRKRCQSVPCTPREHSAVTPSDWYHSRQRAKQQQVLQDLTDLLYGKKQPHNQPSQPQSHAGVQLQVQQTVESRPAAMSTTLNPVLAAIPGRLTTSSAPMSPDCSMHTGDPAEGLYKLRFSGSDMILDRVSSQPHTPMAVPQQILLQGASTKPQQPVIHQHAQTTAASPSQCHAAPTNAANACLPANQTKGMQYPEVHPHRPPAVDLGSPQTSMGYSGTPGIYQEMLHKATPPAVDSPAVTFCESPSLVVCNTTQDDNSAVLLGKANQELVDRNVTDSFYPPTSDTTMMFTMKAQLQPEAISANEAVQIMNSNKEESTLKEPWQTAMQPQSVQPSPTMTLSPATSNQP